MFTGEGNHMLKICFWQFFPKELEAVQISHVARNGLQNLFLRHCSFILKSCWTSGILVFQRFGLFGYLILDTVWTMSRWFCVKGCRGKIPGWILLGYKLLLLFLPGVTILLSPLPSSLLPAHFLQRLKLSLYEVRVLKDCAAFEQLSGKL